jgi:hypothetical protein
VLIFAINVQGATDKMKEIRTSILICITSHSHFFSQGDFCDKPPSLSPIHLRTRQRYVYLHQRNRTHSVDTVSLNKLGNIINSNSCHAKYRSSSTQSIHMQKTTSPTESRERLSVYRENGGPISKTACWPRDNEKPISSLEHYNIVHSNAKNV